MTLLLNGAERTAPVLVVDLDGALLRSDILFESFWNAFGRNWRSPFLSIAALLSGLAALKQYLAKTAKLDACTLPYDSAVIAYVEAWRTKGGRVALITGSDQAFANMVADHLGLFDEAYGSDGNANLKGKTKAFFLKDRFGPGGYTYMGDGPSDMFVWQHAKKAVTVNATQSLKNRTEQLGIEVEHLTTATRALSSYVGALRPHQWLKNILVFLPMLAAHRLNWATLFECFLAFCAFSLVASSVYVLNDLLDLAADRAHPRKHLRPFASGSVPIAHGSWMALGLLAMGITIAAAVGWLFLSVMVAYYLLTTAYSLHLKRRIAIDICVLAGLYTMRIVAGGLAANVSISMWLLGFSIFFFFSLAAVKRQSELVDSARRGKLNASGRGYHVDDLPIMPMIALSSGYVSVLVMALYINSPAVLKLYHQPDALWGICCVLLYWITRIVMVTHRGRMHDDPIVYAAKDRISQISFLMILAFGAGGALL